MTHQFKPDDRLTHAAKPEWGVGRVIAAENTTHEGRRVQRLSVRFERGGLKKLSTAFARLVPADSAPAIADAIDPLRAAAARETAAEQPARRGPPPGLQRGRNEAPPENPLEHLSPDRAREIMGKLPEAAVDPFTSAEKRLAATLRLYAYQPTGASLIEWAAAQSGVADPLSIFSRHDLETFFERFRVNLDRHLPRAVQDARREGVDVAAALASAPPAAQQVMRRGDRLR